MSTHRTANEDSDGWIYPAVSPLLEVALPHFIDGVTACRLGQQDISEPVYERYLPGRLQAIGLSLSPPNSELRLDNRTILKGRTPVGSYAIPPGTRISGSHDGAPDFVQILFEPHGLAAVLEDMAVDPDGFEFKSTYLLADTALLTLSQRLAGAFAMLPRLNALYLETLYQSVLSQLIRRHAANVRGRALRGESLTPAAARRVTDFVEDQIAGSLHLNDLAAVAGSSRAHFARAFRNEFGVTPHTYVVQRRLERALDLLLRSSVAIQDIAERTGFADHAHLTRTFKRYIGVSPSEARH